MTTKKGDQIIKQFEGDNPPDNFDFPSIGIEDIDRAVFELFDSKLNFQVTQKNESKKVPVVFAAGERFALTRRKNPIRDKNNALILPIISIMRGDVDFSPAQNGKKTPIAFREQTKYVIKKRLSDRDRNYQNIINKQGITNQENVSSRRNFAANDVSPGNKAMPGTVSSRRNNATSFISQAGKITLSEDLGKNIFEVIEIPYPEFISIKYDVIFWTQYLSQANQMMETLIVNFDGQGEEITMKTPAGYELVAFFDASFTNASNFDNYSDDERVIKHSISLSVPGYILNPKHPGLPNLVRAYTSAPTIDFGYAESFTEISGDHIEKTELEKDKSFILNDLTSDVQERGTESKIKRGQSSENLKSVIINPFTKEGEVLFSKVLSRNARAGETVATSLIIQQIEDQYE
jgi:hypothetical protein